MSFSSIKEMNRLISEGLSNIYLKVTNKKNWRSQNFLRSSKFKKFVSRSVFVELQFTSLNFKLLVATWKSEAWEQNCVWIFYYFNFEKNHDILKLKSPYSSWNKKVNFNKNETGSKMENPTHSFREMNLVFQLT